MSIVFVFVGQCGNQVGAAVAKKLAENCQVSASSSSAGATATAQAPPAQQNYAGPCFSSDGFLRAVLVDAEPKVVDSVVRSCAGLIRPSNLVTGRSGRGNSWSLGYCGLPETDEAEVQAGAFRVSCAKDQLERDRTVLCRALKAIHAETRRCDDGMVEAIVVLHSLAGGTGSGLGCALIENIRHHFCCDGAAHDKEEEGDGEVVENDPMSWGAPPPRSNNNNARNSKNTQQQAAEKQRRQQKLPPSILPEDMIREGTFGEPRKARFVCSVCVAPMVQGELAVQSINACLTLRTLVRNCDAVFLLRNDCQKLFRGLEHSHVVLPGPSSNKSAVANSFATINNFFASMFVSALQGGRAFGCVAELLEAAVDRVAEVDWNGTAASGHDDNDDDLEEDDVRDEYGRRVGKRYSAATKQQQRGRFEWSEFDGTEELSKNARPRPGARLLTLVPWDPRAPWAAGFRRSSVTVTLCGKDTSRSDTAELLAAYLCNEVRSDRRRNNSSAGNSNNANNSGAPSLESQLCTVLDRSAVTTTYAGLATNASSAALLLSTKPVLVLNQCSELCTSILLPFFRDAAAKVDSGAYMHTFNVRGVLSQVFNAQGTSRSGNNNNNNRATSSTLRKSTTSDRRYSPRRSRGTEEMNAEFARQFVNNALVDLLQYLSVSFPSS